MSKLKFDPKIWFFLKAIWCAVPEITFKELCAAVSELTKKKTPSPDSVRKKCKSENWTKNVRDYCRLADGSLDAVKCRLFDEITKEFEQLQSDISDTHTGTNSKFLPATGIHGFEFEALNNIAYRNRKTIDVLKEHRQRTGKIGQLLDGSMDWMYEAKEAVLADNQTEEQMDAARRKFGLLETVVDKIEVFSRTAKNLMQMDFALFGINIDDTRDSDTADRVSAIQDDTIFDNARSALDKQYADIEKRIGWIEAGEFEQQVLNEMAEQARKEELESEQFDDDEDGDQDVEDG